jgi:hypothetical protein
VDLNLFETDAAKSKDGVWCPIDNVTDIRIARYGNPKFRSYLEREMKPYKRLIDKGALKEETADKILAGAIASTILVDWRNMELNGAPLPYSQESALKILLDPKLRDFRDIVVELSQDMQLFKEQEVQEDAGNSQTS